jgi:hypothetical protein
MLKTRVALILVLFFALHLAPARKPESARVLADSPAAFESLVSPAADADPRDETSIAVSPINERIIVGASKVIVGGGSGRGNTRVGYYYSSDGGATWGGEVLPVETPGKIWDRASDPSVAVDTDGNFYLCVLMLGNVNFDDPSRLRDSGIFLLKSTDGGRTFGDAVAVFADIGNAANPTEADKCYIAIDTSPTSPFKNSIYVVWVSTNPNRIVISHRRAGEAAFSEPKTISHIGDMRGPSVATGPDGEVYAAWQGIGNPRVVLFNASTDGGVTFLPSEIAPSIDYNIHNFKGSLSPPSDVPAINGVQRMNSFPVIDVDHSGGENRGMIHVAWAETASNSNSDIFVKSFRLQNILNKDAQLVPPVKVNNDQTSSDQFFPWLSVDATTGDVEVAFYDRRDEPDDLLMNLYLARSTDGGASFAENVRVSSVSSNPRVQSDVRSSNSLSIGIGDYIALCAARGKAHLLWADTRNQKQEIFYGQVSFGSSGGPVDNGFDSCSTPRAVTSIPYQDQADTRQATSSAGDPASCSGGQDTNSVWYGMTAAVDTVYGIDTVGSDYDTVVSVYTGGCDSLTRIACSDDFGGAISPANRSVLTFTAQAGTPYLIEVSGKSGGGTLRFRLGYPTITSVEYSATPDGTQALRITGAGLVSNSARVIVEKNGEETELPNLILAGGQQGDGSATSVFAWKKKLKKLIKRGNTVIVIVESPAGSGRFSISYSFTR